MNIIGWILITALVIVWLGFLLWWLLIKTEGVYLGRGMVIWLYDVYASRYENIKGYEAPIEARYLGRPIMQVIDPNDAPLVLDVATGTARLPRSLVLQQRFKGMIVGADLSRKMLHYAAGRVAEGMYYGRVHLMHIPAENLPFADNLFDVVTCLEALEFMMSPKKVIAELVRVTRPGGWLLLTNRRGMDAKMMPGKTWSVEEAERIYTEEFGLENVRVQLWQFDYDLVWAQKSGESPATRARPLEEIWQCPNCHHTEMILHENLYTCGHCGSHVSVGKDGVIEVLGYKRGK